MFARKLMQRQFAQANSRTIQFGVGALNVPNDQTELNSIEAIAGAKPTVLLFYRGFTEQIDTTSLNNCRNYGAIPYVTWEPWDSIGPANSTYQLSDIINGNFDSYITTQANTIKNWGHTVWLRFAHEMNGDWYPWCEGVNGNTSGQYVSAWQHIYNLFSSAGVSNVVWVWSPNVSYPGSTALPGLYPGDAYVDRIAVDGYNWGTVNWSGWQTPSELYDDTFAAIASITTAKPLMIGEGASTEQGGDKAAWITSYFDWLTQQPPRFDCFVWFNYNKETDWRINSSTAAANAFAAGVISL